jgi:hypothetical protein
MKGSVENGCGRAVLLAVSFRTERDGRFTAGSKAVIRTELEHVIRAAGAIAESDELVILGIQAILGSFLDPPEELISSIEVDLYPIPEVEKADLIDGSIGEGSPFHDTFGYYAHGVGPETAFLPRRWKDRLVVISNANTRGVKGYCLHPIDIAASKLAAGRERDIEYVRVVKKKKLIELEETRNILQRELPAEVAKRITTLLESL